MEVFLRLRIHISTQVNGTSWYLKSGILWFHLNTRLKFFMVWCYDVEGKYFKNLNFCQNFNKQSLIKKSFKWVLMKTFAYRPGNCGENFPRKKSPISLISNSILKWILFKFIPKNRDPSVRRHRPTSGPCRLAFPPIFVIHRKHRFESSVLI